jgi:hypothetical protein
VRHRIAASGLERPAGLRAIQGLDLAFLIHAEGSKGVGRGVERGRESFQSLPMKSLFRHNKDSRPLFAESTPFRRVHRPARSHG